MLSVLKTILTRLETIEKQLGAPGTVSDEKEIIPEKHKPDRILTSNLENEAKKSL